MSKRWSEMTEEEKAQMILEHEQLQAHQQAVRAKEAIMQKMLDHLKTSKRKRPAPSMLYQFPGFDERDFGKLIEQYQQAETHEREMGDVIYKRHQRQEQAS